MLHLTLQGAFHCGVDELLHIASLAHEAPRALERSPQLHVQLQPDLLRIHRLCVELWQRAFACVQGIGRSSGVQRLRDIITATGACIVLQSQYNL